MANVRTSQGDVVGDIHHLAYSETLYNFRRTVPIGYKFKRKSKPHETNQIRLKLERFLYNYNCEQCPFEIARR